jgi:ketosteroid isomerase-like protein
MKKWILVLLTGLAAAAAQPGPNTAKEAVAACDAWKQAMMKKDGAALQKLLHDDITYSHSNGRNQTKAEVITATTTGNATIETMDFSETTVRVFGTTVLIRANVEMRNAADGKSQTFHLNVLHVWQKGPGGWQMIARQATLVSPTTVQ